MDRQLYNRRLCSCHSSRRLQVCKHRSHSICPDRNSHCNTAVSITIHCSCFRPRYLETTTQLLGQQPASAGLTWLKSEGRLEGCTNSLMTAGAPLRKSRAEFEGPSLAETTTPDLTVRELNSSVLMIFKVAFVLRLCRSGLRGRATVSRSCRTAYITHDMSPSNM